MQVQRGDLILVNVGLHKGDVGFVHAVQPDGIVRVGFGMGEESLFTSDEIGILATLGEEEAREYAVV